MMETSTTISEANLQPNCVEKIAVRLTTAPDDGWAWARGASVVRGRMWCRAGAFGCNSNQRAQGENNGRELCWGNETVGFWWQRSGCSISIAIADLHRWSPDGMAAFSGLSSKPRSQLTPLCRQVCCHPAGPRRLLMRRDAVTCRDRGEGGVGF